MVTSAGHDHRTRPQAAEMDKEKDKERDKSHNHLTHQQLARVRTFRSTFAAFHDRTGLLVESWQSTDTSTGTVNKVATTSLEPNLKGMRYDSTNGLSRAHQHRQAFPPSAQPPSPTPSHSFSRSQPHSGSPPPPLRATTTPPVSPPASRPVHSNSLALAHTRNNHISNNAINHNAINHNADTHPAEADAPPSPTPMTFARAFELVSTGVDGPWMDRRLATWVANGPMASLSPFASPSTGTNANVQYTSFDSSLIDYGPSESASDSESDELDDHDVRDGSPRHLHHGSREERDGLHEHDSPELSDDAEQVHPVFQASREVEIDEAAAGSPDAFQFDGLVDPAASGSPDVFQFGDPVDLPSVGPLDGSQCDDFVGSPPTGFQLDNLDEGMYDPDDHFEHGSHDGADVYDNPPNRNMSTAQQPLDMREDRSRARSIASRLPSVSARAGRRSQSPPLRTVSPEEQGQGGAARYTRSRPSGSQSLADPSGRTGARTSSSYRRDFSHTSQPSPASSSYPQLPYQPHEDDCSICCAPRKKGKRRVASGIGKPLCESCAKSWEESRRGDEWSYDCWADHRRHAILTARAQGRSYAKMVSLQGCPRPPLITEYVALTARHRAPRHARPSEERDRGRLQEDWEQARVEWDKDDGHGGKRTPPQQDRDLYLVAEGSRIRVREAPATAETQNDSASRQATRRQREISVTRDPGLDPRDSETANGSGAKRPARRGREIPDSQVAETTNGVGGQPGRLRRFYNPSVLDLPSRSGVVHANSASRSRSRSHRLEPNRPSQGGSFRPSGPLRYPLRPVEAGGATLTSRDRHRHAEIDNKGVDDAEEMDEDEEMGEEMDAEPDEDLDEEMGEEMDAEPDEDLDEEMGEEPDEDEEDGRDPMDASSEED